MSTEPSPIPPGENPSWRLFLRAWEPLRPELYRYCRSLTRSPWDAEDLAQECLARAFATLALAPEPTRNPRAWLFRVASNLWLNRIRDTQKLSPEPADGAPEPVLDGDPRATREAAGTLIAQLSPQERAAVVLKDAFGFSLEEISEALSTSLGAIKAAIHRGRGKLAIVEPADAPPVRPAVLDAFCAAFNDRDLDRLTALLLEDSTLEYPGFKRETGAHAIRGGTLKGTLFGCPEGGFELVAVPRCEVRGHRGEWILLWWSGEEVHAVVRVEIEGDRIARLRHYYHAPEVLSEVCRELQVPFRTHGHAPTEVPAEVEDAQR